MIWVEECLTIKSLTSASMRDAVFLCSIAKPEWTATSFGIIGKRTGSGFMNAISKSVRTEKL
jgi:hypothetical protein